MVQFALPSHSADVPPSFFGSRDTRPAIIIDAIAVETAAADSPPPKRPRPALSPPSRGRGWAGAAAFALAGFLAGGGAAWKFNDAGGAVLSQFGELGPARAVLTKPRPPDHRDGVSLADLGKSLEALKTASGAQAADLAARIDKLDKAASARLQIIEKSLAGRDVTGSIQPWPAAPAPPLPPVIGQPCKPAPAVSKSSERTRVPRAGWSLREIRDGYALVEDSDGLREVGPGDVLPGAGRIQRVERRSGQWVLVTAAGAIGVDDF